MIAELEQMALICCLPELVSVSFYVMSFLTV